MCVCVLVCDDMIIARGVAINSTASAVNGRLEQDRTSAPKRDAASCWKIFLAYFCGNMKRAILFAFILLNGSCADDINEKIIPSWSAKFLTIFFSPAGV